MTPQDALNNLTKAAHEFRGTLQDHQILAQSVQVLNDYLQKDSAGVWTAEDVAE